MSTGKRYKWQLSNIEFLTSYDDATPGPLAVSAISKANPAVVILSSTTTLGIAGTVGVGKLDSVEGMLEVDEESFIYQVIDGTTVRLLNTDSTAYTTFSGTALFYPGVMTRTCEATSFNRQGGSSPEIDATAVCDLYEQIELGLPSFGTVQIDFHYAPLTTVQAAMQTFQESGEKTALHYALPRSGGERWVLGFVQQLSESGAQGGMWAGSMTFRATGAPVTVTPA